MAYDAITAFAGEAAITCRCPNCFILFAIPNSLEQAYRYERTRAEIYCPLGHAMIPSGKSEADKVRDELAREKHRAEQARADAAYQRSRRTSAEASARAYKGAATRVKNRVKAGVCPWCNRTFENVARHVASKHGDVDCKAHDA